MGLDASLLVQYLDGQSVLLDSLRTSAGVRLMVIMSVYEALHDLGTFAFVALQLFSSGGRYMAAVMDILSLFERLEDIHNKV